MVKTTKNKKSYKKLNKKSRTLKKKTFRKKQVFYLKIKNKSKPIH